MPIEIELRGQRILVVGGSAGIGRGIALATGQAGARLAVVGRRAARLDEVVEKVGSGTAIAADIRDADACNRIVEESVSALGGLDAVVFATGVSILAALDEISPEAWHDILETNTIAPALITKSALPFLSDTGVVMFLSSITVGSGHHGLGAYGASKAALDRTIRAWRIERPDKRFVCVAVGDTDGTDFHREFDLGKAAKLAGKWVAAGVLYQRQMEAGDLGLGIAEILAILLAHPGFTIPEITLIPPGGMMSGSGEQILGHMGEAANEEGRKST